MVSNEMRWTAFCYARVAHKAAGSNRAVQKGLDRLYDALSYSCDVSNRAVAHLVRRARQNVAEFRTYDVAGHVTQHDAAHIVELVGDLFKLNTTVTTLGSVRTRAALVIQYATRGGPVWETPYAEASLAFVDSCAAAEGFDLCRPDVDKVISSLKQGDWNST